MCGLTKTSPDHITCIMSAVPEALCVRDPIYHMYPFLLAGFYPTWTRKDRVYDHFNKMHINSIDTKEENMSRFECVYILLREAPNVMIFLLRNFEDVVNSEFYCYINRVFAVVHCNGVLCYNGMVLSNRKISTVGNEGYVSVDTIII